MQRKLIVILGLTFTVLLLAGCIHTNETGILVKEGKVTKVRYDVIFGGTFTDWRDEMYFDDGTMLMIQNSDLSNIRLNTTGRFVFEKNYFDYDGHRYKFHKLLSVTYYDDLEI